MEPDSSRLEGEIDALRRVNSGTRTDSPDVLPVGRFVVCSVTRARGSSPSASGKKTVCGVCGMGQRTWYDRNVRRVRDLSCGDRRIYLEFEVRQVQCRSASIKEVAEDLRLNWLTVKEIDKRQ